VETRLNQRSIITLHKLIEQRGLPLSEYVKRDLFHSSTAVVISALKTLEKLGESDVFPQLQSLYKNSKEDIRGKVLEFMKNCPHPDFADFLEGLCHSEVSDFLRPRVLVALGGVSSVKPELLDLLRTRCGFEELNTEVRRYAIQGLALAKDYAHLRNIWQDFAAVDKDRPFAIQILKSFQGVQDSDSFKDFVGAYRKLKVKTDDVALALQEAIFYTYSEDGSTQLLFQQNCDRLVGFCRSDSPQEVKFAIEVIDRVGELSIPFFVNAINALLVTDSKDTSVLESKRRLMKSKLELVLRDPNHRKTLGSVVEKMLYRIQKSLEEKLKNSCCKVGENPKADFLEFMESLGNTNLVQTMTQYLKGNPPDEMRRNLILSVLKKLKPSYNARQKALLDSVVKLLLSTDLRVRLSLAIECGRLNLEDSMDSLLESARFLVEVSPQALKKNSGKTLIPIYTMLKGAAGSERLRKSILRSLVRSGDSSSLSFVFQEFIQDKKNQLRDVYSKVPEYTTDDLTFLKSNFLLPRRLNPKQVQASLALLDSCEMLEDKEWVRILYQMRQGSFGEIDRSAHNQIQKILLRSGVTSTIENLNVELRKKNYILEATDVDHLLEAMRGVLRTESKDARNVLADLAFGAIKDENDAFTADLGFLLLSLGEDQGRIMILQALDSADEAIVAKGIQYLREGKMEKAWRLVFKGMGKEDFRVHQQILNYFNEETINVSQKALSGEIVFQITGERLPEYEEAEEDSSDLAEEESERLQQVFSQIRSKRLDNKARFELEKNMKEVTIFFIDIAGYTKKSNTSDISEIMMMLEDFSQIIVPIGEEFQGTLIKKIGDCFMYTYDTPAEAVLASLKIQSELKIYNSQRAEAEHLHTRIGLNTGKVFLKENDVYGDPVNTAARVESKAPKNGLLLNETTFEGVKDIVKFVKMDPIEVKGIAEPLNTYHILEALPGVYETYAKSRESEDDEESF